MNCKGNQLCLIKVPKGAIGEEHNDKIVFITDRSSASALIVYWNYEGELKNQLGVRYGAIADHCLRPIGNPPDDAVDETLLWKKVPEYNKPKEPVTTKD